MVEVRELSQVYVCIDCRDIVNRGGTIDIRWKGFFYGCKHISVDDVKETGIRC